MNPNGTLFETIAQGPLARTLQHVCDHAQGILVPQRNEMNRHPCHWVLPQEDKIYRNNPFAWQRPYNPEQHHQIDSFFTQI